VGDLTVDYFAARGAGIRFVGVLSGFHDKRRFLKEGLSAEHLLSSVSKLPEWLVEHKLVKD
jgi:phosphoglycolate phosphatase-like HAD superfamily hydrolase